MGYKMKGSPMQRNFGIGTSPMKNDKSKKKKETSLEKAKRGLGLTKEQIEEEKRKQKEALKKYEEKYG